MTVASKIKAKKQKPFITKHTWITPKLCNIIGSSCKLISHGIVPANMITYRKHALSQKTPNGIRPCAKLTTSSFGGGILLATPPPLPYLHLGYSFGLVSVKICDLIKGIITINIL